jgi:two-component system, response regulator PdtaR
VELPSETQEVKAMRMTSDNNVVLVVEDDCLLVPMAEELVLIAGFEPLSVRRADDAIRILEQCNEICVVFSDVDMPGAMNGVGLAGIVRRRWPSLGIILVSGRPREHFKELPEGVLLFAKPYPIDKVITALKSLRH